MGRRTKNTETRLMIHSFQDELLHPQPCGGRPVRGAHLRPDRHHMEDHHLLGGGGRGLQVSLSIFFLKKSLKTQNYLQHGRGQNNHIFQQDMFQTQLKQNILVAAYFTTGAAAAHQSFKLEWLP